MHNYRHGTFVVAEHKIYVVPRSKKFKKKRLHYNETIYVLFVVTSVEPDGSIYNTVDG